MSKAPPAIIQAPPIALRREAAAAAMGVSVSLFEAEVRRGRYPQPRKLSDGATGWLYSELVACAHALPVSDLQPGPGRRHTPAPPTMPTEKR
jgi:predicted DNA-binding transcriptional regulator AlpA